MFAGFLLVLLFNFRIHSLMQRKQITILGAGISGLAAAHWLQKDGFDVTILEAKSEPGGAMETRTDQGFLIDYGPNSGLETTPLISQLAEEVGIKDQMIYANSEANKRYILKNGKLHALPTSPPAFFKTNLFSWKAKLRLMKEPFIGKSEDGYYQSIADFVRRRLGNEFLDYAIDPFVSGVFAGDPEKLSVKSAFPKLYRLEEIYGGLIKGMIKGANERKQRNEESKQSAKMFSFVNGMQSFPQAIAKQFEGSIHFNSVVVNIKKLIDDYMITYNQNSGQKEMRTKLILSTLPAHFLSKVVTTLDSNIDYHLNNVFYPKVMVLYLGFNKSAIEQPLDGFGFLIPSKENHKFLGAIWSSTIFPNRAPNDKAAFTIFIGSARKSNDENFTNETIQEVIEDFKSIMNINEEPVLIRQRMWEKAIPQYNIGYIEHENYFEKFEKNNPGFFLSGNYRGGISVGDCVKNSELVYKKIRNLAS